ncbi:DUF2244 domain-containing protein [Alteromonadaceae bacterium M269]|nr:DUF2244 domain-containing protein [Alteromonadaceae bacterium M269]
MVIVQTHKGANQLILKPNRSASWVQTKHLLFVLGGVSLTIALAWSFAGAWVILPFAGLEVGLLAFLMHRVCFATYQQQVIHINDEDIYVQLGVYKPARGWRLNKINVKVIVVEPDHPDDPLGLMLQDQKQCVEIGTFLNIDDKKQLLDELKQFGLSSRKQGKTINMSF